MKRTGGRYVIEGGKRQLVEEPTAPPRSVRPGAALSPGQAARHSKSAAKAAAPKETAPKDAAKADTEQPSKPDPAAIEKASNTAPSKEDN